jgi:hypothetical protein
MTEAAAAPQICTKAEFARLNGWGKSYVSKLGLEGRLVLTADERVDVAASLARIQATTNAPERASEPAIAPQTRTDRDRQAFYDAESSRLDLEERTRKLINRDEVLAALADAVITLRTRFEAWPDRLSPQIAALNADEARIRSLLSDQVEGAFSELSRNFGAIAKGPAP